MTTLGILLILPALLFVAWALWPVLLYTVGIRRVNVTYTDDVKGERVRYSFYHRKGDDLDEVFGTLKQGRGK